MNIDRTEHNGEGSFFIEEGGNILAEMTYVWRDEGRIIIEHTEVGEKLRGLGAGKQLVAEAVKFARNNHIKIIAHCPFARSVLEKTPEYADVLA